MYKFKQKHAQRGMTLIEVLIASALGVVIIMGVSQSMTAMTQSGRTQQNQNNLQATSDLALSYIGFKFRNALSTPCARMSDLDSIKVSKPASGATVLADIEALVNDKGIKVTQNTVTVSGLSAASGAALTTDDVTLFSAKDKQTIVGETGTPGKGIKKININGGFPPAINGNGSYYVISDCKAMDVFEAARTSPASDKVMLETTQHAKFSVNYRGSDGAMVSRLTATTIGVDSKGNLFDKPIGAVAGNSLMGDVELIRIVFGVDTDKNDSIDKYVAAKDLNGLSKDVNVINAEVYVLVRDEKANYAIQGNYTLSIPDTSASSSAGAIPMQELTVTDSKMRRVFSRSITFRNKISI